MQLYLIGGFLGSGKSTAIKQAADILSDRGLRVGVVTNDQGAQLVDSNYFKSFNLPTREVVDGCFCCNYDDLDESINSLLQKNQPDVIFAESVGSCTDIVSTVVNPFKKFYPSQKVQVSVFADARILPVLIKDESYFFEDEIHYIYEKQLEEADLLVVNKIDLLEGEDIENVQSIVQQRYPQKQVVFQNSLSREDVEAWLDLLEEDYASDRPEGERKALDIDYDTYGKGEALLGWLDAELVVETDGESALDSTFQLINMLYGNISHKELPIGHLKFFLDGEDYKRKISFTASDQEKFDYEEEDYKTGRMNLLINARVQAEPEELRNILDEAVEKVEESDGCEVHMHNIACFRPDYPTPTHRMTS